LIQYLASLSKNLLQKIGTAKKYDFAWVHGAAQRLAIHFVLPQKRPQCKFIIYQKKKTCWSQLYIINIWYKGFLRGGDSESNDCQHVRS
jgi:hypothetical protein